MSDKADAYYEQATGEQDDFPRANEFDDGHYEIEITGMKLVKDGALAVIEFNAFPMGGASKAVYDGSDMLALWSENDKAVEIAAKRWKRINVLCGVNMPPSILKQALEVAREAGSSSNLLPHIGCRLEAEKKTSKGFATWSYLNTISVPDRSEATSSTDDLDLDNNSPF